MKELLSFDFYHIFLFFIVYAVLGWIIEVVFHIFTLNKFVNRGFLYGPIAPIYGFGAVIIILLLRPFEHNVFYIFLGGAIVASVLEYITGYLLEKLFDTRWWDYSDEMFNIKGYVSLKFSLAWGFAAVILLKVIHPYVDLFINTIPQYLIAPLSKLLLIILLADISLTLASLIEFRKLVRELVIVKEILKERRMERELFLKEKVENIYIRLKKRHIYLLKAYPHITSGKLSRLIKEIEEIKNKR